MRFFDDKKNVLLIVTTLVSFFFGYLLYQQNQVIEVLNREVLQQAQKQHRTLLDKYALEKEMQRLKSAQTTSCDSLNQ